MRTLRPCSRLWSISLDTLYIFSYLKELLVIALRQSVWENYSYLHSYRILLLVFIAHQSAIVLIFVYDRRTLCS
jgi:hypothetical protein